MTKRKEYKVVHPFRDLQDKSKTFPNGRVYAIGDIYSYKNAADERIKELASTKNAIRKVLIKPIEVVRTLENCTAVELRHIAKEKGIKGYYNMTKAELIKAIEGD